MLPSLIWSFPNLLLSAPRICQQPLCVCRGDCLICYLLRWCPIRDPTYQTLFKIPMANDLHWLCVPNVQILLHGADIYLGPMCVLSPVAGSFATTIGVLIVTQSIVQDVGSDLLLSHLEHGERVPDRAPGDGLWPPLQRIRSLWRRNYIHYRGVAAKTWLSNNAARHRDNVVRAYGALNSTAKRPVAPYGTECLK
jgi:hypothetical protein